MRHEIRSPEINLLNNNSITYKKGNMIKINNLLTVEHDLSKFLFKDPVSSTLLWYFLLDHPGGDDNGSSVSIKELADKLNFTSRVIQKRIDYLEENGLIISFTPEFYGGQRLPSIYQINFDSEFFVKPPKKSTPKEESPDVDLMIEKFTEINLAIHKEKYAPDTPQQRSKWVKGAEKILTLKPDGNNFTMKTYEEVVLFLAEQMKEHLVNNTAYMMQCRDLGNLVYTHPSQSDCKYINAYRKMTHGSTNTNTENINEQTSRYKEHGISTHDSLWEEV
jgi:biotin operon repressor|tara:strand:+ start:21 stop:851 length:831 start_codon:yes stop_codon:yes gene_type:complete